MCSNLLGDAKALKPEIHPQYNSKARYTVVLLSQKTRTHARTHAPTHAYAHTPAHTPRIHTQKHTHTHIHTHTYIYIKLKDFSSLCVCVCLCLCVCVCVCVCFFFCTLYKFTFLNKSEPNFSHIFSLVLKRPQVCMKPKFCDSFRPFDLLCRERVPILRQKMAACARVIRDSVVSVILAGVGTTSRK
jgi:hypothetical protein